MKRVICFLFVLTVSIINGVMVRARETILEAVQADSTYLIYQKQKSALYVSRGMPKDEIDKILHEYKVNKISSNEIFAKILGTLYPSDEGIGIIFYFFSKDTLKRIFFEPGIVKEISSVAIKKDSLLQLSIEIGNSLKLYKLTENRAPVLRGMTLNNPSQTQFSFDDVIEKTTQILIPDSFSDKYKHLIIIPALNIGSIPFHLLKPYKDNSFIIDKCSFSFAPSLLDIVEIRTRYFRKNYYGMEDIDVALAQITPFNKFAKAQPTTFNLINPLFVANPFYPVNDEYIFPDLPGAKTEIDSAINYASRYKLLAGKEVIKDSVIKFMNGCDLAYFATHAVASQTNPMEKSFLVLSGKDAYFTAKELMDLRLNPYFIFPELVILSACQTGLGKPMEAGIAGLARPFLIGGSDNVIVSLWNVDDNSTAYLMSRFMYYLSQPSLFLPSGPLRLAILDTKKKFPNPVYWASFSSFGVDY
jgi:CHAT domain-containing protein